MSEALKAFRSGGYAVVDKDDDITVLDLAPAAAVTGFENMIHTQREVIFFAIRGVAQQFMEGDGGADAHTDTGVQQGRVRVLDWTGLLSFRRVFGKGAV